MEGFFVFGIAQFQFVMCFPKLIHGIFKQISNTSSKNWSLSYLCVNRFLNRTQSFTGGAISNFAQWEGSWEFHYQTNASYCTYSRRFQHFVSLSLKKYGNVENVLCNSVVQIFAVEIAQILMIVCFHFSWAITWFLLRAEKTVTFFSNPRRNVKYAFS